MSTNSSIAIIVVTFNCRDALVETVRSVRQLNDPRVTLWIVDGGSTDGTVDFLCTLDEAAIRWSSEPDSGIYDAMNKGWGRVPADHWVLYMGAGDRPVALPRSESLQDAAAHGVRIVLGDCCIGDCLFESRWTDELLRGNTAHHQALMIHKSLHPTPPFDTTMRVYADWEFNVRLFVSGEPAWHDDTFRSYALPGGISAEINLWEVWRICRRYAGFIGGLRAVRANWRAKRSLARARRSASD